jgi:hypothetical protein
MRVAPALKLAASIVAVVVSLACIAGSATMFWAYTVDLDTLTVQATVTYADCFETQIPRKRAESCWANLYLTYTFNNFTYINVPVYYAPCGYYCTVPNATVFVGFFRGDPMEVNAVESTEVHHHVGYLWAAGIAMGIGIVCTPLCIYMSCLAATACGEDTDARKRLLTN